MGADMLVPSPGASANPHPCPQPAPGPPNPPRPCPCATPLLQVDLGREAFHLHAFNYNFRKLRKSVSFPVPLYPLAAPQCLVETFEPGEHISRYVAR